MMMTVSVSRAHCDVLTVANLKTAIFCPEVCLRLFTEVVCLGFTLLYTVLLSRYPMKLQLEACQLLDLGAWRLDKAQRATKRHHYCYCLGSLSRYWWARQVVILRGLHVQVASS